LVGAGELAHGVVRDQLAAAVQDQHAGVLHVRRAHALGVSGEHDLRKAIAVQIADRGSAGRLEIAFCTRAALGVDGVALVPDLVFAAREQLLARVGAAAV
jgi:hypothetical protein